MADDVQITRLDVVKEYSSKLKKFRIAALACGADIDVHIRRIKSDMDRRKGDVQSQLRNLSGVKDRIVKRYEPIRKESLPGSEVAGNTDQSIQTAYQQMETMVADYNRTIESIQSKMAEIGQLTKNFCTILDSETMACNKKVDDMIVTMEEYGNS